MDLSVYQIVGYSAVAVLVVGWLIVSFTPPTPRRAIVEWISATAMFTALLSLFAHLVQRAWEQDSTVGLVAFSLLLGLFSAGFCVSLVNVVLSFRGPRKEQTSPTH